MPLSRKKVFAAAEFLNRTAPDILLLNHVPLLHYALPLLGSEIKTVAVLHSDDPRFYRIATLFSSRIFRWIAPAPALANHCISYLPTRLSNRLRVIPHGVREDVFYPAEKSSKKTEGKISFVGFLGETKGADLLPAITLEVLHHCPTTRLTLMGEGPLRSLLEQRFRDAGLADRCEFTGSVPRNTVAQRLRESDVFLLPTKLEGFGLTIVEAMLSGAVPVVSKLPGITDRIVQDGVTGFIEEIGDVPGFAAAVIKLLKDPALLRCMSEAARTTAVAGYSTGKMIDAYQSLFEEDDDREDMPRCGALGWVRETMGELMKKGIKLKWLIDRAREIGN
jgi:glycosyltransferase involved in cell wall biosynthesis